MINVTADDVLKFIVKDQKLIGIQIGDLVLPETDIKTLQSEAKFLESSMLWKLLCNQIQLAAQIQALDNAKDYHDVSFGRGILRGVSLVNEILSRIDQVELEK